MVSNVVKRYLQGKILKNTKIFRDFQEAGFDYILNPDTGELQDRKSTRLNSSHAT